MHGEGGQATVEWVALVLTAALVLAGAGALAGREADRELGEGVAERITRAAAAAGVPAAAAPMSSVSGRPSAGPMSSATDRPSAAAPAGHVVRIRPISGRFRTTWTDAAPRVRAAPPAPASGPRAVDAFRSLRGVADVAKRAWIVCLGYRRWKHELEHPAAPNEALPVDVALSIVNTCFNPHDYLLEEE